MRKLILPVSILLLVAFVASIVAAVWEKPLPAMKEVEAFDGRVSLMLPEDARLSETLSCSAYYEGDGWNVQIEEMPGLASADFPASEIKVMQSGGASGQIIETPTPDLIIKYAQPYNGRERALLRHTDGSVLLVTVYCTDEDKPDAGHRLSQAILRSVKAGPRHLDWSAREVAFSHEGAGVTLAVPLPEGFWHGCDVWETTSRLSIIRMEPVKAYPGTVCMISANITNKAPDKPNTREADETTYRDGTLLGQKMQWGLLPQADRKTLISGFVPLGETGYYLSIGILCPNEEVDGAISIAEGIHAPAESFITPGTTK